MGLAKVGLNAVKVLEIASISLSGETAGELGIHGVAVTRIKSGPEDNRRLPHRLPRQRGVKKHPKPAAH